MIDVRNSSFRGLAGRAGSIGKCPGEGVIVLYLARARDCMCCMCQRTIVVVVVVAVVVCRRLSLSE